MASVTVTHQPVYGLPRKPKAVGAGPMLYYPTAATWAPGSDRFQGPARGSQWTVIGSPTITFPSPHTPYPAVAGGVSLQMSLTGADGLSQPVPALPWKAVLGFVFSSTAAATHMFGLFAANSSGTVRGMGCYTDTNLYAPLGGSSHSYDGTHTTFSPHSQNGVPIGYPGAGGDSSSHVAPLVYRVGSADNATISLEVSYDGGFTWFAASPYSTGLTIDRIFIGSILGTCSPQLLFFNWE